MTRQKSNAKERDGRALRRPLPPPPTPASPLPTKKQPSSISRITVADGGVVKSSIEVDVPVTTSRDKRTTRSVSKYEPNKNVPDPLGIHESAAGLEGRKIFKLKDHPRSSEMTENNPRRSQRMKVAAPVDLPAPHMIRGVNKYGFQIWIPAPEATDTTKKLGGTEATPKTRFAQAASLVDDASTNATPGAPKLRPNNKTAEGSVLGKRSRSDRDNGLDVRGETDEARDDALDNSNSEDLRSSAKNDPLQDAGTEDIGEQDHPSSVSQDVDMDDVDVDSDDTIAPISISQHAHRNTSRCTLPGPVQGEENNGVEAVGPTAAGISRKPPTPGPPNWRAADRMTATGVHFFNMPVEDLREMTQVQALEQSRKRRPQSSDELRALFVSAVTDDQTTPEQYALEHARVKLQAGRNATYGIQLKERMATMRMFAARAMQQPRDVIEELAAIVEEARTELAAAQTALDSDIQDVASAKQDLENLTGMPVSDPNDSAIEEDALRRDNMISEINAVIAKYRAQAEAHE